MSRPNINRTPKEEAAIRDARAICPQAQPVGCPVCVVDRCDPKADLEEKTLNLRAEAYFNDQRGCCAGNGEHLNKFQWNVGFYDGELHRDGQPDGRWRSKERPCDQAWYVLLCH
ncbi:hypothetical protein MTO96_045311 [Rhipicephalus appendiculatus]